MKPLKSSSALKADARELLLGKYKPTVAAYFIMELLISMVLSFFQTPGNLRTPAGLVIYYAGYFIILLLSSVFMVGQNYLYLNIYREKEFATNNLWYGFRFCADRTMFVYLVILGKSLLCTIPCIIATVLLVSTKNYYLFLLVAACVIYALIATTVISIDYSQALYLILDHPDLSARQLLAQSKEMMKGHRGSYFFLLVSFFGIFLLSIMTFGIGMLWIYPYFTATKTGYYLELYSKYKPAQSIDISI